MNNKAEPKQSKADRGRRMVMSVALIGAILLAVVSVWSLNRSAEDAAPVAGTQTAAPQPH